VKEEAEGVRLDKPVEARTGIAEREKDPLFRKRTNESEGREKVRLRTMVAGTSPANRSRTRAAPVEHGKNRRGGIAEFI